ncbi:MAG: T9SS type A sorting domain-containing protein [Chitinophagales bacterium]|nr:T9SS type A sorting domain-containing protein [Chitinophagales bacterium]
MKFLYSLIAFSFAITCMQAQTCAGRYQSDIFTNVDVTTYDYGSAVNMAGNTQVLKLDLYTPVGDTATDRPVVILCFGGSFYAGSRTSSELVTIATSLAKKGYVAASIDYRLASSMFDLISEETMVKVVFGAVQDGKAAIRYFRKNFDEGNSFGIDADQIFIGGTSAGGILAINLAYVDSLGKLPTTWQDWACEIGGMEGNSGNPGYCSYVSGVFGFAGAVGDTSYINANDVPFYGCHATGDQTVQYGYGAPLNGLAPVSLYGSGNIGTRLNNLGVYNWLDTYNGSEHPPFGNGGLATTNSNLTSFLYNILDCNPSNMKKAYQQGCSSLTSPTSLNEVLLNLPLDNDSSQSYSATELVWNTMECDYAYYEIEIDTNEFFTQNPNIYSSTSQNYNLSNLEPNTTYYWHVRGSNDNVNYDNWSDTYSFKTISEQNFYLISPSNNSFGLDYDSLYFDWSDDSSNVDGYVIYLDTVSDFSSAYAQIISNVNSSNYVFDSLASGQDYYWKVVSVQSDTSGGTVNVSSSTWKFRTKDLTGIGVINCPLGLPGWNIFPNPTENVLNIEYENHVIDQLYIYNVVGNQVFETKGIENRATTIDVSNFSKGVYYIKAFTEGQWVQDKFIVK